MLITKSDLISKPSKIRPHIVILGAGASCAAFPDGDAEGKKLPTMANLIEIVGLDSILVESGIEYNNPNFELIYSELYGKDPESPLLRKIEDTVYAYFNSLRLPDGPTLYDHLLMSLRPKDLIATFNWDPFLFDAWNRNRYEIPVPQIAHLHGNVRIGYCLEHRVQGENGRYCPECEKELTPSRLLYPITEKNYSKDPFISKEWELLKSWLRSAMTLTVFGYSAPQSDKEAIDLMKNAWGKENRFIERIEIIDIKNKKELWNQWHPFILRTYFDHVRDYYESRLSIYPRRTCEALAEQTHYGFFVEDNPIPKNKDFHELLSWFKQLVAAEREE